MGRLYSTQSYDRVNSRCQSDAIYVTVNVISSIIERMAERTNGVAQNSIAKSWILDTFFEKIQAVECFSKQKAITLPQTLRESKSSLLFRQPVLPFSPLQFRLCILLLHYTLHWLRLFHYCGLSIWIYIFCLYQGRFRTLVQPLYHKRDWVEKYKNFTDWNGCLKLILSPLMNTCCKSYNLLMTCYTEVVFYSVIIM